MYMSINQGRTVHVQMMPAAGGQLPRTARQNEASSSRRRVSRHSYFAGRARHSVSNALMTH